MLGENHSLAHEFPEHLDVIEELVGNDDSFATCASQYHALDKQIRTLELRGAPIDDDAMSQLKLDRAGLKDVLHKQILNAK